MKTVVEPIRQNVADERNHFWLPHLLLRSPHVRDKHPIFSFSISPIMAAFLDRADGGRVSRMTTAGGESIPPVFSLLLLPILQIDATGADHLRRRLPVASRCSMLLRQRVDGVSAETVSQRRAGRRASPSNPGWLCRSTSLASSGRAAYSIPHAD